MVGFFTNEQQPKKMIVRGGMARRGLGRPAAPAIPSWVSALPLWEWYEIPNTALSSVEPVPEPQGYAAAKIDAWCGAALKRAGSVYMIGAAGGHSDYVGNEVDALALNVEVPQWVQLRGPSAGADVIEASYYLDYRPGSTHTYYASQFIDSLNRLMVFCRGGPGGVTITDAPVDWPYTDMNKWSKSFNLATGDWDTPEYIPGFQSDTGDTTASLIAKHQVTEDVYVSRGFGDGFYRWTRATNMWSKLSNLTRNYCGAAVDPTRSQILAAGDYSGNVNPLLLSLDGVNLNGVFGGIGASGLQASGYPGLIYDEANDMFIFAKNGATDIEVRTVTAGGLVVAIPTMTGTPPLKRTNGVQNSIQYVPELRGFALANKYADNVYFVRTAL